VISPLADERPFGKAAQADHGDATATDRGPQRRHWPLPLGGLDSETRLVRSSLARSRCEILLGNHSSRRQCHNAQSRGSLKVPAGNAEHVAGTMVHCLSGAKGVLDMTFEMTQPGGTCDQVAAGCDHIIDENDVAFG